MGKACENCGSENIPKSIILRCDDKHSRAKEFAVSVSLQVCLAVNSNKTNYQPRALDESNYEMWANNNQMHHRGPWNKKENHESHVNLQPTQK